jgi:hypothetical protein
VTGKRSPVDPARQVPSMCRSAKYVIAVPFTACSVAGAGVVVWGWVRWR